MKKIGLLLLSAILAVLLVSAFAACVNINNGGEDQEEDNSHEHVFVNYVYNNDVTCGNPGTETAKCEECSKTDTRPSEDHPATEEHHFVNNVCTQCGIKYYTKGLDYGENNEGYTVKGKGTATDTDIIIPSTYNGKPVTSIGYEAFYGCSSLTSIEISNGVTDINGYAFDNCSKLVRIMIPDSVTNIGVWAFRNTAYYNDKSNWENRVLYIGKHLIVADATISESYIIKQGTINIAYEAFSACSGLTSITIPSSVKRIGAGAFSLCRNLLSITYLGDIKGWCEISGFSSLMCYGKSNRTLRIGGKEITGELTIPNNVTSINNYAFYNCRGLTSINIPDSVTSIGVSAFRDCRSLTSITLPHSASIMYAAFRDCISLTSLKIPDGVTNIGFNAFGGCTGLASVEIPKSVTDLSGGTFYNCDGLSSITYLGDIEDWCKIYGLGGLMYYGKSNRTLTIGGKEITGELTIPNNVTSISSYAFCNCKGLTSINIPDSVTSIEHHAFLGCSSLASIDIPNSVVIEEEAFYDTAYYNNENNWRNKVLYLGKHLLAAKNTLSGLYTVEQGTLTIADRAFRDCRLLTSIEIPDSVTSIGSGAFSGCRSLTSIEIPDSVTSIGEYAFGNCSSLTSIEIPDSVTSIGDEAFWYCSSLTSIEIPNSVTSIGNHAFSDCSSLTSIEIPNSVTSIGNHAFRYCSSLTSIEIPNSVTSIGEYAFSDCSSLTIYCEATEKPEGWRNDWNSSNRPVVWGYSG